MATKATKVYNYGCPPIPSRYERGKAAARQRAIDWQHDQSRRAMSWAEVAEWQGHFLKLARRFGLVREFKENGIL